MQGSAWHEANKQPFLGFTGCCLCCKYSVVPPSVHVPHLSCSAAMLPHEMQLCCLLSLTGYHSSCLSTPVPVAYCSLLFSCPLTACMSRAVPVLPCGVCCVQVIESHHTFLDRQVLLLRCCTEPLNQADLMRLDRAGLRGSALGRAGVDCNPAVPAWLQKWAALTLEFVEQERLLLPGVSGDTCHKHMLHGQGPAVAAMLLFVPKHQM